MRRPEPTSDKLRFAALWLLAGALEAPAAALLLGWVWDLPAAAFLLGHLGAAAVVFFAPPRDKGFLLRNRHWGLPMALLALLIPGAGWALAGWLVLSRWNAPAEKDAYRFEDEVSAEDDPVFLGEQEALHRDLAETADVLPAVDALLSRDPALKRGAIETLARLRTPEAVRWIFSARTDRDPEVRFFATSALTRLKREYEAAVAAAEREAAERPGEPAAQLAPPRIRCEYAASGLLDPRAREAVLDECRAALAGPAERSAEALALLFRVERIARPERALELLDRLQERDPLAASRWRRERAELLFALRRYGELRGVFKEELVRTAPPPARSQPAPGSGWDPDWRAAALWWSHG